MRARDSELPEVTGLDEQRETKRRFLLRTAVACTLAIIVLNGVLLWRMNTGVPVSMELDLSRQSEEITIEFGGLFPGRYHLAIESSLPDDFKEAKSFYRGIGAKRIHQDLDVDLELLLMDENGRSLIKVEDGTREWKIYNSLLLIALIMIVVLAWAHRFGESDEDVPSLASR